MHSSSPQSGKRIRKRNCLVFPPGSGNSQFTSRSIQKRSSPSGQPTKYHSDIMTLYLLGRMSERWLVPGSLGKIHMLKRVRYKLYEDSGNFSFSKFGRSSGQGCARTSPLKTKPNCCILHPQRRKHNAWWTSSFWRQHVPHLGTLLRPICWVTCEVTARSGAHGRAIEPDQHKEPEQLLRNGIRAELR